MGGSYSGNSSEILRSSDCYKSHLNHFSNSSIGPNEQSFPLRYNTRSLFARRRWSDFITVVIRWSCSIADPVTGSVILTGGVETLDTVSRWGNMWWCHDITPAEQVRWPGLAGGSGEAEAGPGESRLRGLLGDPGGLGGKYLNCLRFSVSVH